jgi:ParB family chromosome partitioning protein
MLDPDYGFTAEYRRVHPKPAPLPPEIAEGLSRIEQRLAELDDLAEDDWTAELAAEAEQLEERHKELARAADAQSAYSDEDRAAAGCIVTIGDRGDFLVYEGRRRARGRARCRLPAHPQRPIRPRRGPDAGLQPDA